MIIPVLDMKDQMCVSGKSGMRDTYTKLHSIYGDDPIEIAKNLRSDGAQLLYVADLDRIEGCGNNSKLISKINQIIPVLLDNGISNIEDVKYDKNLCSYYILATETMEDFNGIKQILKVCDSKRIFISIDIKNNELLIKDNDINLDDIIGLINEYKPRAIITLNISNVGTKKHNTNTIIREVFQKTPDIRHVCAGGITNKTVAKYKDTNDFLIGTILHEGNLDHEF